MNNTLDKSTLDQDAELRKEIDKKTVDLLYKALPGSAIATIIIAATLSVVMGSFFKANEIILWFAVLASINVARLVLY